MWDTAIEAEELVHISRYQTFLADKKSIIYEAHTKLIKKMAHIWATSS